ncbi:hypothetical protein ABZV31_19560 [Streptomyces sp. NPDC005202]|uniref:hypothetical protein n=1 Tax=Streptomyces sp. NPDC005202 TaxID=3157021 RepID=UPI0033BD0545
MPVHARLAQAHFPPQLLRQRGTSPADALDAERPPAAGSTVPVIGAVVLRGRFGRVEVNSERLRAVPVYTAEGLSVRMVKR